MRQELRGAQTAGDASSASRAPDDRMLSIISILFLAIAVGLMAVRLSYGIDLTDETYPLAEAYRFVLGDGPFTASVSPVQITSLLLYPWLAAYVAVVGGTTGAVFFFRLLCLAFLLTAAGATFSALKSLMKWQFALLVALPLVTFMPWNLSGLSYNVLGGGFLVMALALGLRVTHAGAGWTSAALAGVALGLACVGYPTFVSVAPAVLVLWTVMLERGRRRYVLGSIAGALSVAAVLAGIILRAGMDGVSQMTNYVVAIRGHGGGLGKLLSEGREFASFLLSEPVFLLALVVIVLATRLIGNKALLGVVLIPLTLLDVSGVPALTSSLAYVVLIGLAGATLLVFYGRGRGARAVGLGLVVPGVFAGAVTVYTSVGGFLALGVGMLPLVVATGYAMTASVERAESHEPRIRRWAPVVLALALGLMALIPVRFAYANTYRDARIPDLVQRVDFGPYRGIATTSERYSMLRSLSDDLAQHSASGESILFFEKLPGGYLMSDLRPATNSTWLSERDLEAKDGRNWTIDYYERTGDLPDVVVVSTYTSKYDREYYETHPLAEYFADLGYGAVTLRDEYCILRRIRPPSG